MKVLALAMMFSFSLQTDSPARPVSQSSEEEIPLDVNLEDGITSIYTSTISKLIKNWPASQGVRETSDLTPEVPIKTVCYETKNEPYFIGIQQKMWIKANFKTVEKVIDEVETYRDFIPDFEDIKILGSTKNRKLVYWEQESPLPFMENIKYKSIYELIKPTPNIKIYRQQLKEGNYLKSSDSVIIIEKIDEQTTRYTEYGFWDAHWGLAKTFGLEGTIWSENVLGNTQSALGFKLKSENPEWPGEKIHTSAKDQARKGNWENAIQQKISPP